MLSRFTILCISCPGLTHCSLLPCSLKQHLSYPPVPSPWLPPFDPVVTSLALLDSAYVLSYVICLSRSDLSHVAQRPRAPSELLQTAGCSFSRPTSMASHTHTIFANSSRPAQCFEHSRSPWTACWVLSAEVNCSCINELKNSILRLEVYEVILKEKQSLL